MKRVGLKYCGGCDPDYDRAEYMRKLQEIAGDRIEWVPMDEGGFTTLLLITGCDKQCLEEVQYEETGRRIISIKNDKIPPEKILSLLTDEGENHD